MRACQFAPPGVRWRDAPCSIQVSRQPSSRRARRDSSRPTAVEPTRQGIACIVWGGSDVEPFLDLGSTALANKFLSADEVGAPEPHYPLEVGFCHACGHVQLTQAVPPAAMFEDYLYVSSASDTL